MGEYNKQGECSKYFIAVALGEERNGLFQGAYKKLNQHECLTN